MAFDKDARTITIADNGIGMSRDEVVENIGTIAKSGTREFFASLSGDQAKDAQLIGQFGVGFYSAFIVADRVTLVDPPRRAAGRRRRALGVGGRGRYTIERSSEPMRGTEVTLHLREGEDELLSRWRLRPIIRKYSDHIAVPILMTKEEWDEEKKGYSRHRRRRDRQPGAARCGRARSSEVTTEQYEEFYKHVAHDSRRRSRTCTPGRGPHRIHAAAVHSGGCAVRPVGPRAPPRREAVRAPRVHHGRRRAADAAVPALRARRRSIRNDLPLNVSREILQESRDVRGDPRTAAIKRVLDLLEELAREQDKEKYATFWKSSARC